MPSIAYPAALSGVSRAVVRSHAEVAYHLIKPASGEQIDRSPGLVRLTDDAFALLEKIGCDLDTGIFPVIENGGFVKPGEPAVTPSHTGGEISYEQRFRQRGPEAGQGAWPPGWQGTPGGPGSPGTAAPVLKPRLRDAYRQHMVNMEVSYPGVRFREMQDRLRVMATSSLMTGCSREVVFIGEFPYSDERVKTWGFWNGMSWIGPRHTNFPDGSICSYEPEDGTWLPGDSLVALFDLHTLWALRHLHLEVFERWPGYQAVGNAYERITELRDNEYCGCNSSTPKLYGECCKPTDLKRDRIADAVRFTLMTHGGQRSAPPKMQAAARTGILNYCETTST